MMSKCSTVKKNQFNLKFWRGFEAIFSVLFWQFSKGCLSGQIVPLFILQATSCNYLTCFAAHLSLIKEINFLIKYFSIFHNPFLQQSNHCAMPSVLADAKFCSCELFDSKSFCNACCGGHMWVIFK